jgi:3-deoxy-manno-octulosonate cytidylyltransferase (CMP-KDO synthetase)
MLDELSMLEGKKKKTLVVIPARMASKRLPGKPLLMAGGQALVHWTYAQAKNTKADHVVVATPDREIGRYCRDNDITWMTTSEDHPNGTSRCWEIVEKSKVEFDRVVNWQVDEPCVNPSDVDMLLKPRRLGEVGTLAFPACHFPHDPNVVKVVYSCGKCHWFSRAPMRGAGTHIGVYSFSPSDLSKLAMQKPSCYGRAENLEQLTWMETGYELWLWEVGGDGPPLSVNSQDDWDRFKELVEGEEACPSSK